MTITIDLLPEETARLAADAHERGLSLEEYVHHRLTGRDPQMASQSLSPTAALFAQWDSEDVTDDPEELARRQRDGDELLKSLAEHPISFRRVELGDVDGEDAADLAA